MHTQHLYSIQSVINKYINSQLPWSWCALIDDKHFHLFNVSQCDCSWKSVETSLKDFQSGAYFALHVFKWIYIFKWMAYRLDWTTKINGKWALFWPYGKCMKNSASFLNIAHSMSIFKCLFKVFLFHLNLFK